MLFPCFLLLLLSTLVSGQLPYPLAGQGSRASPPNSLEGQPRLPVAVVALLERALGLNPNDNTYQVRCTFMTPQHRRRTGHIHHRKAGRRYRSW